VVRSTPLTNRVEKPSLETATALDGLALGTQGLAGRALVIDFTLPIPPRRAS
jgi:hypothetical protein